MAMAGKTPVRNKPIMIYLHPNTEDYDPGAGKSLLVNLGSLDGYQDVRLAASVSLALARLSLP